MIHGRARNKNRSEYILEVSPNFWECHNVVGDWLSEGLWDRKSKNSKWYDLLSPLSLGNRLVGPRCLFLSTLPLSEQTGTCTWAHACILGMSFLIFLLLFFQPPRPPPPTSPHSTPPPPFPSSPIGLWWRQGSNRRSICIYITHVMCSVLLYGWAAQHGINMTLWKSHACHLKPSSQGSFHMKHELSGADF